MIRRLRVVLPPAWVILVFVASYLLLTLWLPFLSWLVGVPIQFNARQGPGAMGAAALVFGALGYGAYRVAGFHPFYRPGYRRWLEVVPWTRRKPLPAGPIHPVWEDGLIFLAAAVPGEALGQIHPSTLLTLALVPYLAGLGVAAWHTGARPFAHATAFGLALVLRLWRWPVAYAAATAGVALVALVGLRRSLARFPWDLRWQDEKKDNDRLGWPVDRLGPKVVAKAGAPARDVWLGCALAGWWLHAVGSVFPPPERDKFFELAVLLVAWIGAQARCMAYLIGYAPPIGVWGRLATGRWIIPGYDKVFLAPAAALLVALIVPRELMTAGVPADVAWPLALTLTLLVLLRGGPGLAEWRLTGQHRLTPGGSGGPFVKVG
jgi:hypothetical protein